jgi:hypothetical protein
VNDEEFEKAFAKAWNYKILPGIIVGRIFRFITDPKVIISFIIVSLFWYVFFT